MIFKVLCGIIIVFGFAYGGFCYGERLKTRLTTLQELCDSLSMLEFNIRYMNYPLRRAFEYAGKNRKSAVGEVFRRCSYFMGQSAGKSPNEAFCDALDENIKRLNISNDETEILKSFSASLGESDTEGEISNIKTAKLRLSSALDDAKEDIQKRVKMSRGLGILSGVFIVIVLI